MSQSRFVAYLSQEDIAQKINENGKQETISRLFDDLPPPTYIQELIESAPLFWRNQHWHEWVTLALQIAYDDLFDENGQIKNKVADALDKNAGFYQLQADMRNNLKEMDVSENSYDSRIKLSLFKAYYANFFMAPINELMVNNDQMDPTIMEKFYAYLRKTIKLDLPLTDAAQDQINYTYFAQWASQVGGITVDNINIAMANHSHQIVEDHVPERIKNEKDFVLPQLNSEAPKQAEFSGDSIAAQKKPEKKEENFVLPRRGERPKQTTSSPVKQPPELRNSIAPAKPEPGFFARNWPYLAGGFAFAATAAALVAIAVTTFGIGLIPALITIGVIFAGGALITGIGYSNYHIETSSTKKMHDGGLRLDASNKKVVGDHSSLTNRAENTITQRNVPNPNPSEPSTSTIRLGGKKNE